MHGQMKEMGLVQHHHRNYWHFQAGAISRVLESGASGFNFEYSDVAIAGACLLIFFIGC